jgi:hypothetical protein
MAAGCRPEAATTAAPMSSSPPLQEPGSGPHPGDHPIRDWRRAGLLRASLLQTKLATVETSVLGKRLGQLSASDLAAFDRGVREALQL